MRVRTRIRDQTRSLECVYKNGDEDATGSRKRKRGRPRRIKENQEGEYTPPLQSTVSVCSPMRIPILRDHHRDLKLYSRGRNTRTCCHHPSHQPTVPYPCEREREKGAPSIVHHPCHSLRRHVNCSHYQFSLTHRHPRPQGTRHARRRRARLRCY
jgi:hypothetical protein